MSEATRSSRTARIAQWLGVAALALSAVGVLLSQLGLPAMAGFRLFTLAILLGVVGLLCGLAGLFTTRGGVAGRQQALAGIGLGAIMIAIVVVGAGSGGSAPPINDITTNLNDPPSFAPAPEGHRNAGRDMSYPADWKPIVEAAYPDLAPIRPGATREQAYDAALAAAEDLGWEITRRDGEGLVFEAEDRTALFRFVDDVVVRVGDDGTGQPVVDVRSKSRDGRGDVGANAARIRRFAASLTEQLDSDVATGP
jgi:uncharacterized protein (DUF1499 family)